MQKPSTRKFHGIPSLKSSAMTPLADAPVLARPMLENFQLATPALMSG
jgi:hypothetical protein